MAGWPGSLVPRIFANDQACTYLTAAGFVHSSCVPCPGRADCRWPWDVQERQSIEEPAMWLQCNLGLLISRTLRQERWGVDRESSQHKMNLPYKALHPSHLTCFCETLCRHLQPPPHTQTLDLGRSGTLIASLSFQNTPVTSDAFKSRLISHNSPPSQTFSPCKFRGSQDQPLPSGLFSLLPAWTPLSLVAFYTWTSFTGVPRSSKCILELSFWKRIFIYLYLS